MADNSAKFVKTARVLAKGHIIVGSFIIIFGIADLLIDLSEIYIGYLWLGLWTGVWMCITGGLAMGIPGSAEERSRTRNYFGWVFMGFSIISATLGGTIVITSAIVIAVLASDSGHVNGAKLTIVVFMLILGIATLSMGIAASINLCLMKVCGCCNGPTQSQVTVTYSSATAGYVMTQDPDGVAVAIPVQGGGAMAPMQAPYAQESEPPIVQVLVLGKDGGQPMMV